MPMHETGILVLGFTRPLLLGMLLESLSRQGGLPVTHVWIDGTADRIELPAGNIQCRETAERFAVAEVRTHRGHLGIEKLMLDALQSMIARYARIIVLEDDCFPTRRALEVFDQGLAMIAQRPEIFSVYGHPFLSPAEGATITRFQGWGWASTREKLAPVLQRNRELFNLPERDYLEFTHRSLTPDIVARLDVTPPRDVCAVLGRFFSWDSCTALLTAIAGQVHMRTPERVVFNCGLGGDSGHFAEADHLRQPPFNMIRPDEAWQHF